MKLMLAVTIVLVPRYSQSQVDPEWLKSWNQAVGLRPDKVTSTSVLVSAEEPGIPLVVKGQLFQPDGQAVAKNVLIHLYHRDHAGFDFGRNDKQLTTWRLQGWAKTDEEGKFEFHTIRPAADHLGREGGHFHFTIVSEEFGKQWMNKIHFLDDPHISNKDKQRASVLGQFSWLAEVQTLKGIQYVDLAFKLKAQADF